MNTLLHHYLFILVFILFFISCSEFTKDKIVGEWKGTDHSGDTASFVFYDNGNAKIIFGNLVHNCSWQLDKSKDPMYLDLVFTESSGLSQILPMIMRFITDNKIQLRMNEDMKTRPTEFSYSDTKFQLILAKQ